jgi:DNA-binding NtrC family response regulator
VVDDEPEILNLVSRALECRGFEVHVAPNPMRALKIVHDSPCFDLVISDVIMPEMCGSEFVRRVGHLCPESSVVLMSAYVDPERIPENARFLSKPFRIGDLYSAVNSALAD